MSDRMRAFTGSPFEKQFGFARAVRADDRIIVAGTGPVEDDGSSTDGDAAAQAERCLVLIMRAVEELGGSAADVVRTRMFLTDPADQSAVGAVHARFFAKASPAATMVGAAWLCRPEWKVEIEAEARVSAEPGPEHADHEQQG
ncbi:RidA family protein [Qipengyuania marisflavi]|uniref:RidA family protein n=1 Tax=Qipengyuania marisflavi TaxID=2486356 RepID=A0A5S3P8J5_9SPHN|nr:RidA family protein [Qipengyuania marisflavi]TMM47310.1 RidA family protein [Qipengyuania marisflavi]